MKNKSEVTGFRISKDIKIVIVTTFHMLKTLVETQKIF